MYEIQINHTKENGGPTTYRIYTQKECDKEGKNYVYWKDAGEGDLALSDDGYVAPVIKKKEYIKGNGNKSVYLRLPWGYFMWNPKYPTIKFNAEGRSSPHTFSGKTYLKANRKSEKIRNLAMCYAQTMNKDLAIDLAFGSLTSAQHGTWTRRMKTEEFRDMVREELQKLLTKHGLTEDYTLDLLEETINQAKDKKDTTNLMRAVENLQNMHGMKDMKTMKTTTQIEGTVTRKLIDEIHEEERRLKATQTEVKPHESQELSSQGEETVLPDETGEISEEEN